MFFNQQHIMFCSSRTTLTKHFQDDVVFYQLKSKIISQKYLSIFNIISLRLMMGPEYGWIWVREAFYERPKTHVSSLTSIILCYS